MMPLMKRYEFTFESANSVNYTKPITVLVLEPDRITPETGVMLFTHGWGGNRFQHEDKMRASADAFNLVCLSVEFRQSGYDFNPVTGRGADMPYDASFYQVFDVLNGLRYMLDLRPTLNRRRLFHYGGSQGGHIALLSTLYAPHTFAFIYASCPATYLDSEIRLWPGRSFNVDERSIRDVPAHTDAIQTPIYIEYGTADLTVNCDRHSRALEQQLIASGRPGVFKAYAGGGHDLMPTISKLNAFLENVPPLMQSATRDEPDDFLVGATVTIETPGNRLIIDWSRPTGSHDLFRWETPMGIG